MTRSPPRLRRVVKSPQLLHFNSGDVDHVTMNNVLRRWRDAWDVAMRPPAYPVTDEHGVLIDIEKLNVRQILVLMLRMGPRIMTRLAAFDEGQKTLLSRTDELNYNIMTLEVFMSEISDALAEQGEAIGRLATSVDDELATLQAQLADAQERIDNEEAADLAEALATVEGIRANTAQLTSMADSLAENDAPAEEPVESEAPAEPGPVDPGTEVEEPVEPADPDAEPEPPAQVDR